MDPQKVTTAVALGAFAIGAGYLHVLNRFKNSTEGQHENGNENDSTTIVEETTLSSDLARECQTLPSQTLAVEQSELEGQSVTIDNSVGNGNNSTENINHSENATGICQNGGGDNSEQLSGDVGGDNSEQLSVDVGRDDWEQLSVDVGGDNSEQLSVDVGGDNSGQLSGDARGDIIFELLTEAGDDDRLRDKKKFFRLIEFSYELSLNVVRAFVESNILKDYKDSLEHFLNTHKHKIYHLWIFNTPCCIGVCTKNKNRELRHDQLIKLYDLPIYSTSGHFQKRGNSVTQYCACGINVRNSCSLKKLDITLIHTVLRHCVTLQSDEDMWLNTIRDIRNKLAHVESITDFDAGRLDKWWDMLEGSVLGLARKIKPSFYYDSIECQINSIRKSDFESSYIQDILVKLKAENQQFHDNIKKDIKQVSRFLEDNVMKQLKEIKDVVVDIRNLSFKVAPQEPSQLRIQNSISTESCDFQESNVCYVKWKIDTPNSWQVQQIKDMLEHFSAMLCVAFKVEVVSLGSLIIVTTVPTHVIMDRQAFEVAIGCFLQKIVEVCEIDTNSPATVHVDLTLLQDFNDLCPIDKDEVETVPQVVESVSPVVESVQPVVESDEKEIQNVQQVVVRGAGLPITPVASSESSKPKESLKENKQTVESESTENTDMGSQVSTTPFISQGSLETDAAPLTPRERVPDLLSNISFPHETEEEIFREENIQRFSFQEAISSTPSQPVVHMPNTQSESVQSEVKGVTDRTRQLQQQIDLGDLSVKQTKDGRGLSVQPQISVPHSDAEPYISSGDKKEEIEEPPADGVILHAEDDRDCAIEFIKNMELEIPDLNLDILIYEQLRGDRFLLQSAADLFDTCRYLFILMSKNFKNSDLERFQAEISLIESITNPMKKSRVIPVAMDSECKVPELRLLIPLRYDKYLEGKSENRTDTAVLNVFRSLIKKGRKNFLPC